MTTTTEIPRFTVPDTSLGYETQSSAEEVERQVLTRLAEVIDPTTETHQLFYGDPGVLGVKKTVLKELDEPISGCRVLIQDETEHTVTVNDAVRIVPAFKRRGAWFAVIGDKLRNPELRETTAASSGNHAKSLVSASQQLGMTATIFMAKNSDPAKQKSLRDLGANLDTSSENLAEALQRSKEYAAKSSETAFIHPYDDYDVIAGQATAASEMLQNLVYREQAGEFDLQKDRVLIAVPLGGGGLAAATGIVFKNARDHGIIGENVRILAVQPENKSTNQFCDGTMTQTGEKAQSILSDKHYIQGTVTVRDEEVAEAMAYLYQTTGKRIEPAGALASSLATIGLARDGDVLVAMVSGASVSDEKFNQGMDMATENGYDTAFLHPATKSVATTVLRGTNVWNGK